MSVPRKAQLVRVFQRRVLNPVTRVLVASGLLPTHVLLETIGRRTGRPHATPVGNGVRGDTLWLVAEHGPHADYVRNIEANPQVRVKVGRRAWRTGTAHLLPDDDPRQRLRLIGRPVNAAAVRLFGSHLLSVRVDLDT
jgi:deazaflavin-dependent oxidoreductase (nitroreductase family)